MTARCSRRRVATGAALVALALLPGLAACAPAAPRGGEPEAASADPTAGPGDGRTLIATTAEGPRGAIMISENGTEWESVLDARPLYDMAAGQDRYVAVGSGGAIWTSADARSWAEVATVADPLNGVAYGGGAWVAIGDAADVAGDESRGAIYRSTDGVSWTRVATPSPYDNGALDAAGIRYQGLISVAYGDGLWAIAGQDCAEPTPDQRAAGNHASNCVAVQFHSRDGVDWTRHALAAGLAGMHVAYGADAWGFVGDAGGTATACDADPYGVSGTSDDALTWRFGPTQPDCLLLTALVYGESEWLALDLLSVGEAAEIRAHRSDDLVTWTPVGQPLLGATSILHASPLPD